MKTNHWMCILFIVAATSVSAQAITLTDANFTGTPVITLPTSWTTTSPELLFDGVTANITNVRTIFSRNTGSALSALNFISIVVDIESPFTVTAIRLAHDANSAADQEVTNMQVLFNGSAGLLGDFSASGLNDGIINDIDDVVTGLNLAGVTSIEFRITGSENTQIEVREIVIEGFFIPEPGTATLGLLSVAGMMLRRRRLA